MGVSLICILWVVICVHVVSHFHFNWQKFLPYFAFIYLSWLSCLSNHSLKFEVSNIELLHLSFSFPSSTIPTICFPSSTIPTICFWIVMRGIGFLVFIGFVWLDLSFYKSFLMYPTHLIFTSTFGLVKLNLTNKNVRTRALGISTPWISKTKSTQPQHDVNVFV